ncbi:MAG: ribose 5-phosphate isomerase B [Thermoleophilia bacterium]|nr:ribose 5-phosphate isomerase B [Thermoleophilia bacterium]
MRYAVGCDHAGFVLKEPLVAELKAAGHEVLDMGTNGPESVDFPVFAGRVAEAIGRGEADMGLLICGTGLGMAITANRYPGIRAVSLSDVFSARMARRHNDANVLCLGARVLGVGAAIEVLRAWLEEEFEGGRHARRLEMMPGGYKGGKTN